AAAAGAGCRGVSLAARIPAPRCRDGGPDGGGAGVAGPPAPLALLDAGAPPAADPGAARKTPPAAENPPPAAPKAPAAAKTPPPRPQPPAWLRMPPSRTRWTLARIRGQPHRALAAGAGAR